MVENKVNNIKKDKLYIIFSICILLVSFFIVTKELPNDTFFTIRIGQDTLKSGINNLDTLTFHEGLYFVHLRWAFDVVIALLYKFFSYSGIYLFTAGISSLIFITMFNILLKKNTNIVFAFIITSISILLTGGFICARAQIISYLMFVLEVYFIEKLLETKKRKYLIYLAIIALILVNFHASVFPVYFVLYLPYIAEFAFYNLKKKYDKNHEIVNNEEIQKIGKLFADKIDIRLLITSGIISFFTSLISPTFVSTYTYMFKFMSGYAKDIIVELQPVDFITSIGMLGIFVILIIFFVFKNSKIKVSDFFMLFGLFLLPFFAIRNAPFLYLLIPFYFSKITVYNQKINEMLASFEKDVRNYKPWRYILILYMFISIGTSIVNNYYTDFVNKKLYPVDATNYIIDNLDTENMRIFNHFNFGSYLELNNILSFIDSRGEVYCSNFNNTNVMEDWSKTVRGKINYKETFEKYNITHALLYKKEVINQYICDDDNYKVIYDDEYFVLYEKVN